jgi:hypothetical protein
MKLHKHLMAVLVATAFATASANACFVPVCLPNPSNCGPKPPVSDCSGVPVIKPPCVIVIIIKVIFGCK